MVKRGGQPPRPTTDSLSTASQDGAKINRRHKQHQIKKKHKFERRGKLRERTASSGSTRGAFGPHPDAEAEPPVAQVQVTLPRIKKKRFPVRTSYDAVVYDGSSSTENLGRIAACSIEDEEQGIHCYRANRQPRNNNTYEVLNHKPLPPHPFSGDNVSPASATEWSSKHMDRGDEKQVGKSIWSHGHSSNERFLRKHFGNGRHESLGNEDDYYLERSNYLCHDPRPSSSESVFNGESLRTSKSFTSKSFTSNDAPSSCLDGSYICEQVQYCQPSNDISRFVENVNNSADYNSINNSCPVFDSNPSYEEPTLFERFIDRQYDEPSFFKDFMHDQFEHFIYDPGKPEFTTLQQSFWAVVIGVMMGVITALWGGLIEFCVDCIWRTVPEYLYERGVFTDLHGHLPLPHYMWICPGLFGGVLSCISALYPVPGQNEWIKSLHSLGIMDHRTLIQILLISTAGMASGLSLGPELPLVLTAGMVGSFFGKQFHQSMLSARVMNLTAASAAIAGFFGFPMAGALFVLELPHRMGLQYFEALSPAILASIFAVLVNRIVTGDEVKGYFEYPQLNETLPSYMFGIAFVYAFVGLSVGITYAKGCLFLKKWVHDWFHVREENQYHAENNDVHAIECDPLIKKTEQHFLFQDRPKEDHVDGFRFTDIVGWFGITHEPTRAALAGTLAGVLVGVICMFVPHSLFWGEAQLQTLIDRGRTPLPVFGNGDEPTALLTAYGYCLNDAEDVPTPAGFGTACAGIISITKILVIGLSLGTGIIGGHFWGPLYVGCAASHFFVDIWSIFSLKLGFGSQISEYPCVAMLCIMGSAHVVTFRANMAIMLILTLSIRSFSADFSNGVSSNYSAIFPLLVVSCFLSLQATKKITFYAQQRCRGDITAIPKVLCEPDLNGSMYDDSDDLELNSTESITETYNRCGESQYSMDNLSLDGSGTVCYDSCDISSDNSSFQLVPMLSPQVDRVEGSSDVARNEKNLLISPEVKVAPAEQVNKNPTHRRIRSGGTAHTCPETVSSSTANSTSIRSGGIAPTSNTSSMQRIRSGSSVSSARSARSSGPIEEFAPSLLDQGRNNCLTTPLSPRNTARSRSNTPDPRRHNSATKSRSITPCRPSNADRSRSITPRRPSNANMSNSKTPRPSKLLAPLNHK